MWMQNTTMSYGHPYVNYTEDARELLTGASKLVTLTPIPRKFIPKGLFQWNVSLGTGGLSPTLGNKMHTAVRELRAFHLPKPLKCKLGEKGDLQADLPGPAWRPQYSHPSAVRTSMCTKSASLSNPDTDLGKERRVRSSVTMRMADNKVGNHSGLLLRKRLSQDGLSCTVGTHRIWRLAAPAGWLSLAAVTYNGHNSCVLEQCHGVSNSQKKHKGAQSNVLHSKAGLNLCPQPFPTSYLPLPQSCHTRLFPPLPSPLPSHLGCATPTFCPWGRWFSLRSGYLLPDTPTLLSLDPSALPYPCLVNNKCLVTNIQNRV